MKLSEVMWVQAGYGSSRRVMPFVLKGDIICSVADDKLFQLHSNKSMFDNIYELCQNEYKYSTVVMGDGSRKGIPCLDTTKEDEPRIMGFKLPTLFVLKHKQEYKTKKDMNVSESELKALAKHFNRQLSKSLQNSIER